MKTALVFLPVRLPHAPSLGPACLKAYLKERDHDVTLLDYNVKMYNAISESHPEAGKWWDMEESWAWTDLDFYKKTIEPLITPYFRELAKEIIQKKIDAVGFTVLNVNYFPAITAISILRGMIPELKIFYGGPNITRENSNYDMEKGRIDAAVIGEGEETCHELLTNWKEGKYKKIAGAIVKGKGGEILEGPERPLMKIKELPIPDFEDIDLSVYNSKYLPLEFSRGCTAKCTFCSETVFWVSYRSKTAKQIFEEMKYQVEKYKIHEYRIVDSLINGNHRILEELVDLILEDGLQVHWYGFARIDKKLTPEMLKKMKKAGCLFVTYGIESGSQKVLNLMKKDYLLPDIYQVVKDTSQAGIGVNTQILIGFPGEGWYQFYETLKMLWDLKPYFARIFPGTPLAVTPNTHIIDNLDQYKIVKNNHRGGHWRTKYYTNTIHIRKFRAWLLLQFLKCLRMPEGYPVAHALGPELDRVDNKI